ncbi:MAG: DUF308 domain-containing protein [Firmicutes bacterium]|nr:DUF308 domain-containing protein [Bacillota bacterium]
MKLNELFNRVFFLSVISSIVSILLGCLLIFETSASIETMAVILGILLILLGAFIIGRYISSELFRSIFDFSLLYSFLSIISGVLILMDNSLITIIISAYIFANLMMSAINKINLAVVIKKLDLGNWVLPLLVSLLLIAASVVVIINPINSTIVVTKTVGVVVIISAIIDLIEMIAIKCKVKNVKKELLDLFK